MTPPANALARRIAAIVRRDGPITIERYWNLALFDRDEGYYSRREPFGAGGDFVTAPEISQMFGELVGAWLVAAWRALECPAPFVLAEMGPGRGTLMADILRTAGRLDTGFLKAARVTLVETSERLALIQAQRLERFDLSLRHVKRLDDVEQGPLLLVANELFDAVAIRQFVRAADGWRERCVGLDAEGRLAFGLVAAELKRQDGDARGAFPVEAPIGATLELSPQRLAIAGAIAARIAAHGGAALMIDYGHSDGAYGDTLQAMKAHGFADPLATPGECDITSHVDFAALARRFGAAGLAVAPVMQQGAFLVRLGLAERAGALGRGRPAGEQAAIEAAASRLAGTAEGEMGSLFKVLAAASHALPLPPFQPERPD